MPHLDSERLVLLALGEQAPTPDDSAHLTACPACRAEIDALTEVAGLGRAGRELRDLPAPPDRVWELIAAGTGISTMDGRASGTASALPVGPAVPTRPGGPTRPPRGPSRSAPGGRPATPGRPGRRWLRTALVAVVAAIVGVGGTVGVNSLTSRPSSLPSNDSTVTARADLAAYGSTPATAHGSASVLTGHGQEVLRLHVANLPAEPGYYEVWLIDPQTLKMFSIGVLGGQSDVDLPLPSDVDLTDYRLVDISAELYDGNAAHSGHSLLRGRLTA